MPQLDLELICGGENGQSETFPFYHANAVFVVKMCQPYLRPVFA